MNFGIPSKANDYLITHLYQERTLKSLLLRSNYLSTNSLNLKIKRVAIENVLLYLSTSLL